MLVRLVLIAALTVAVAGCSKKADEASEEPQEWPKHGLTEAQAGEVLAKVGDRTITVGEFAERLASQSPYLRARFESPERRREFLDNLIRFELLVYEAKRRGYADNPEIVRARRNAMIQQLIKREVDEPLAETPITDAEVEAVYEANPTEFDRPEQLRASHVLVTNEARGQKVLATAKKADIAGFRKLAREQSEDEATKDDGGDLRFFEADGEGAPSKAIRKAAFSIGKVGAVYPELIEDDDGYHVIMLTGRRPALTRTFEQAKRAIRHKLTRERKNASMEALMERLRQDIKVEVDYDALSEVQVDGPEFPKTL